MSSSIVDLDPELLNPSRRLEGVERLMLALIGTLVDDLRGRNPSLRAQGRAYMFRQDTSEPLGFTAICSHFGWPEALVRKELEKKDCRSRQTRWRSYSG